METIAAVRYRQYYNQWSQGTEYFDSLARLAYLMVTASEGLKHPLIRPNKSKTQAIIAIGSHRGLCGGPALLPRRHRGVCGSSLRARARQASLRRG